MNLHPKTSSASPGRYLRHRTSGRVYPWTEKLALRGDLVEVAGPEPTASQVIEPVPGIDDLAAPISVATDDDGDDQTAPPVDPDTEAAADAVLDELTSDPEPEPTPATEPTVAIEVPDRDTVLAFVDKDELETYARRFGVELDKRRALVRLQHELLAAFGMGLE